MDDDARTERAFLKPEVNGAVGRESFGVRARSERGFRNDRWVCRRLGSVSCGALSGRLLNTWKQAGESRRRNYHWLLDQ